MKTILITMMMFMFTASLVMANGGPSFEKLYKASQKDKPVVELIDQSIKKTEKQICLTNSAQNKVKEKPC